jgi:hypothetical protein
MTALTSWILGTDTIILFLLALPIIWFGAIIYCIPVKQYIDGEALKAQRRDIANGLAQGEVSALSSM